jgi:hypothetical protein
MRLQRLAPTLTNLQGRVELCRSLSLTTGSSGQENTNPLTRKGLNGPGAKARMFTVLDQENTITRATVRKALPVLRAADDDPECTGALHGGGCTDEAHELLAKMIELADHTGMVWHRWSDLDSTDRARDTLKVVGFLSGESKRYQLNFARILTEAAKARRELAAIAAYDRIMAQDLSRWQL